MPLVEFVGLLWTSFSESSRCSRISVKYSKLDLISGIFTSLVHNSFRFIPGPLTECPYNNWNGLNPVYLISGIFTSLVHKSFRFIPGPLTERRYNNWNGLNPVDSWGTSLLVNRRDQSVSLLQLVLTKTFKHGIQGSIPSLNQSICR